MSSLRDSGSLYTLREVPQSSSQSNPDSSSFHLLSTHIYQTSNSPPARAADLKNLGSIPKKGLDAYVH